MFKSQFLIFFLGLICFSPLRGQPAYPTLKVSKNHRYLVHQDGTPFFWLGGTSWGMAEYLTREEIQLYLDDRHAKGFNVVQLCAFWGKRVENPVNFFLNPPNAYGQRAFDEDVKVPAVVNGGTPDAPNDYWDHLEFILREAKSRSMVVALLPVWGRRYVNAIHKSFGHAAFTEEAMKSYGKFLGERYSDFENIIWVMGGDVKADAGGDFRPHYRAMAEGIVQGLTGKEAFWNQPSPLWDYALMTYHPDGAPYHNSSTWFHKDVWLDFNMIETFNNRDDVYQAVYNDYQLADPIKPTVNGEPGYEGANPNNVITLGVHMRRQALQTYFAGAAGFTYGGKIDSLGNGPLWSPSNNWPSMLKMEGARTLQYTKLFCITRGWISWVPDNDLVDLDEGEGELQIVAVRNTPRKEYYIYFPESRSLDIEIEKLEGVKELVVQWFNTADGNYSKKEKLAVSSDTLSFVLPEDWSDGILILKIQST